MPYLFLVHLFKTGGQNSSGGQVAHSTTCLAKMLHRILSAINRQMISVGAIRVGELHYAGPVPDEGDCPTELEGKWGVDGTWIDPKLLIAGRKE